MSSIRLKPEQIARLKKDGQAAATIRYALKRWKRGDFEIGDRPVKRETSEQLQVFPIWRKPEGVADWQLREILTKHWEIPDRILQEKCEREIAYWDGIIEQEFAKLAAMGPVIIENTED